MHFYPQILVLSLIHYVIFSAHCVSGRDRSNKKNNKWFKHCREIAEKSGKYRKQEYMLS